MKKKRRVIIDLESTERNSIPSRRIKMKMRIIQDRSKLTRN